MNDLFRASTKRPVGRYLVLAMIFAVAVVYHLRLLQDILHGEKVSVPFFAPTNASATIDLVTPQRRKQEFTVATPWGRP